MLRLYQILSFISAPFIALYLLRRLITGKEDRKRFKERLGYASLPRPTGQLAWVHGASVGESVSVLPLIEKLSKSLPNLNFLITSGTLNSAKVIAQRLPKNALHQYIPVDSIFCVKRFLKHWQPDIAIFIESELWPNAVTITSKQCPFILVNGHLSVKSYNNWQKYPSLAKEVFSALNLCIAQNELDAGRFHKLGVNNVKCFGNLKYDAPPLPHDEAQTAQLKKMIGNRPILVAASTHDGKGQNEEQIIGSAHKSLKAQHPNLLTIIIPRHPVRKNSILNSLTELSLEIAVRSSQQEITKNTDIYLADTIGELGIFYRLADIVFIGGSLIPRGGHNPIEPAHLNCAIIVGPHTFNFVEINQEFIDHKAILIAENKRDLVEKVSNLITDKKKKVSLASAANKLVKGKNGILEEIAKQILPYLPNKNIKHKKTNAT